MIDATRREKNLITIKVHGQKKVVVEEFLGVRGFGLCRGIPGFLGIHLMDMRETTNGHMVQDEPNW